MPSIYMDIWLLDFVILKEPYSGKQPTIKSYNYRHLKFLSEWDPILSKNKTGKTWDPRPP